MGTRGPWQDIASLARWAPTPHNAQPFRIRPLADAKRAELVLLTERLLPREDHGNAYVLASFGTFAACLERAAKHFGYALSVKPVAELEPGGIEERGPEVVLGEAELVGEVPPEPADLLEARRTSRLPYHDRPLDPAALAALERLAVQHDHRFVHEGDPSVVGAVLRLNAEAIIDNLQLDEEREEIRKWYRLGATPPFGDGLWREPMNQPSWELWSAFAAPWAFKLSGLRAFAVSRYLLTQAGTRKVGLLCGRFQSWDELLHAGRFLLEFWLEMAHHGVYMQPMGSMLTNAHYAEAIARRFGCEDCWLVFRLGYSDVPPRSPRLESLISP